MHKTLKRIGRKDCNSVLKKLITNNIYQKKFIKWFSNEKSPQLLYIDKKQKNG